MPDPKKLLFGRQLAKGNNGKLINRGPLAGGRCFRFKAGYPGRSFQRERILERVPRLAGR